MLCKDSLQYHNQLSIEGLLGITMDRQDIFLVNINETVFSDVKKDGRRKSAKGGKRAAPGTSPSPGKKAKTPKPKRKRKSEQQVSPIVIRPSLGALSIKQEDDHSFGNYNDTLPLGYDDADFNCAPAPALTPKKTPKKKRKTTPNVDVRHLFCVCFS